MPNKSKPRNVYQFKITLKDIKPPIWRRIQVPENYNFWELHCAIQSAMGWGGGHMHDFSFTNNKLNERITISTPMPEFAFGDELSEFKEKVSNFIPNRYKSCTYTYDFGDNWEHQILFERIIPAEKDVEYPRCIKGARACPPEDCGSVPGYYNLLEILKNPKHEEHEEMLGWLGGEYDPEYFDANEVEFIDPDEELEFVQKFREEFGEF